MQGNLLINKLLEKEIIQKEDVDIYSFGLECLLLKILNYSSFIVIAVLMKMPLELLLIAFSFIPLRRSAGGYHAKTRKVCFIISCGIVVNALLMCRIIDSMYIWMLLLLISDIVVFKLAPIDNEAKKMSYYEKKHYRAKSMKVLSLLNVLCIILLLFEKEMLIQGIIAGVLASTLLLLLGEMTKKEY